MYHDQGQIAMKLIGFDRGVTLIAGYGFPIVTPAHGSAYDIAGTGRADPGATLAAARLARDLAALNPADRPRRILGPDWAAAGVAEVAAAE
jgi:4-hydroxythreonine-4-phosphate dehydrogenase